ncbi:MAG: hypothetical protein M0R06_04660 [Sphaerochaeta sp.]|jgi:hypothetical protein|nr:hypothetical protein [Sphaerochaeta sp.]
MTPRDRLQQIKARCVDSASSTVITPVSKPEHRLSATAALEWYKWN